MADSSPSREPRWALTPGAFEGLLARLDADREQAGERYELLRRKLVRFFEWRGALSAEDRADETLNRVARRLEGGEEVRDVTSYAAGVARLVWREAAKHQDRERELDGRTITCAIEAEAAEETNRFECLEVCLASLPDGQRELVLEYFTEAKGAKIDSRKQMAARLGLEMNALRIRVHRIRARLELCVKECVNRRGAR